MDMCGAKKIGRLSARSTIMTRTSQLSLALTISVFMSISALAYFVQPKPVFPLAADTDHYVQDLRARGIR
jgi:hypothetical protein